MVSFTTPILIHFELLTLKNYFNFIYTPKDWSNIHLNSIFSFLIRFSKSKNYITHLSLRLLNNPGCRVLRMLHRHQADQWGVSLVLLRVWQWIQRILILQQYRTHSICVLYVYYMRNIHVSYTYFTLLNCSSTISTLRNFFIVDIMTSDNSKHR